MIILNVGNLCKSFGEQMLFEKVSFDVQDNDKIGLVGVNGCGKTTLMKILTAQKAAQTNSEKTQDSGNISIAKDITIGYVEQHVSNDATNTVFEELLCVFEDVIKTQQQLNDVTKKIELLAKQQNPSDMDQINKLAQTQARFSESFIQNDGLTYQNRAKATLLGLGFQEAMLSQEIRTLSGGEKAKVLLAKMLLSKANLLLLDEPTNHLDIAAVEWLEDFLKNYRGAAIIISHDRYFLDAVTNKTFELQNNSLKTYRGNYSSFFEQKQKQREIDAHHYKSQKREIDRIQGIVDQQRRWNREKNIVTAESKEKQIERLKKDLVKIEETPQSVRFRFQPKITSGNDVLSVKGLQKSFDEKLLFENVNFELKKNDRVFLLGSNGSGKTTMLKILMNEQRSDSGEFFFGSNVIKEYFDQTQQNLSFAKSAIDEIWDSFPTMKETEIRKALATFLFKKDEVFKEIKNLSGGEKARIALLKLMLAGANLLVLDEPTNHLDIFTREVLEQALLDYDGTLFLVSHDRYFINKLSTKILYLEKNGVKSYIGSYDDYIEQKQKQTKNQQNDLKQDKQKNTQPTSNYNLQKQQQKELRKTQTQLKNIEKELEQLENKIRQIETKLCDIEIAADYIKITELSLELEQTKQICQEKYEQWEELCEM